MTLGPDLVYQKFAISKVEKLVDILQSSVDWDEELMFLILLTNKTDLKTRKIRANRKNRPIHSQCRQ